MAGTNIDLAFSIAPDAPFDDVAKGWTHVMYQEHGAVTQVDVWKGKILYRVFLVGGTLQVDLAFWPFTEFGATGPTFRLIFGTAQSRPAEPASDNASLVGLGWLYALHVRSSLKRGRVWQAEVMLHDMRDQVLTLACRRHGYSAHEGRGLDDLPRELLGALEQTLPGTLDDVALQRAFAVTMQLLLGRPTSTARTSLASSARWRQAESALDGLEPPLRPPHPSDAPCPQRLPDGPLFSRPGVAYGGTWTGVHERQD